MGRPSDYFHSKTFISDFPLSSTACSNTPTTLLRRVSVVEAVWKYTAPRQELARPALTKRPIPWPVELTVSPSLVMMRPWDSTINRVPSGLRTTTEVKEILTCESSSRPLPCADDSTRGVPPSPGGKTRCPATWTVNRPNSSPNMTVPPLPHRRYGAGIPPPSARTDSLRLHPHRRTRPDRDFGAVAGHQDPRSGRPRRAARLGQGSQSKSIVRLPGRPRVA